MSFSDRYPAPSRRYLPSDFEVLDWSNAQPFYTELTDRPLDTLDALETWVFDRSELDAYVGAEASRRMIRAARFTDDQEAEEKWLAFETEFIPQLSPVSDALDHRFLDCPFRHDLDNHKWEIYVRDSELAVELFCQENIPLAAEEAKLANRFGQIAGAMTVLYQGKELTLAALGTYAESPDRSIREETWRLATQRRGQDKETLESLFEEMLALRAQEAKNAGFDNYRDYKHRAWGRFDYSPADCEAFHKNVERFVLPALERMRTHRKKCLRLESLRPWDLAVDLDQAEAFEPFQNEAEHVSVAASLLEKIHSPFADDLRWMQESDLLDLATRPHKRPGGFMDTFADVRVPFIFANSGTTHSDVETLIHEVGHAVHALAAREMEPSDYHDAPLEFAEVASMAMESMAMEHLDSVYPEQEARRATRASLESCVSTFAWVATIDAFQHWLYTHEQHTREERAEAWVETRARFSAGIDWSGLEAERVYEWQKQLHLFEVPFYYIEYGIAQNGALQVWKSYLDDPKAAIERYRQGLALGGSRPLPELYDAAGIRFDPQGACLEDLIPALEKAWRAVNK
ncbi:MAG: M3 family oligoendopeptidase [Planctomycetes bacterium]|jgi:oligoendopeptidase F|nr:M3 family oligoendopeptidase [Planctomycetota bacterium]MBT4560645.1 M3 family oligoendopeptidase [Planctomycetota bacterium]MBT5100411.1 M3 family oligoendopeptidase [Planctomycetota bacterium]MBT5120139.1 M3 family oligoendopeptidase [Planctomycetota bacterium]MBT7013188.1 M3 family oligoendopeptidase [Planctomycetota bacterium]